MGPITGMFSDSEFCNFTIICALWNRLLLVIISLCFNRFFHSAENLMTFFKDKFKSFVS
jgi:hypothetical protein